ncbi:hypothetical protein Y032_0007g3283 [Ancylostoma ceylanicum]|uniref:Uncharacterized protein n=1 Tax=Ancylostoma ceylanicum TaxID=53326 RepID=A0A016VPA2_9BILA|nr:hypothetical protein Y032_0007g3283 [Ancylostoma ceylanicum]
MYHLLAELEQRSAFGVLLNGVRAVQPATAAQHRTETSVKPPIRHETVKVKAAKEVTPRSARKCESPSATPVQLRELSMTSTSAVLLVFDSPLDAARVLHSSK